MGTTNELASAVEAAVAMTECGRVWVNNNYLGQPLTDRAEVSLVNNFHISKAELIKRGRALRAALFAAGFKMNKATVRCSWHMGHPLDWYYTFTVGA